jgi:hypothetical protein
VIAFSAALHPPRFRGVMRVVVRGSAVDFTVAVQRCVRVSLREIAA